MHVVICLGAHPALHPLSFLLLHIAQWIHISDIYIYIYIYTFELFGTNVKTKSCVWFLKYRNYAIVAICTVLKHVMSGGYLFACLLSCI
jgi:hypothetical protein